MSRPQADGVLKIKSLDLELYYTMLVYMYSTTVNFEGWWLAFVASSTPPITLLIRSGAGGEEKVVGCLYYFVTTLSVVNFHLPSRY